MRALVAAIVLFVALARPAMAASNTDKIDPALLTRMAADRTRLLPVVVEMSPVLSTLLSLSPAQQALEILRLYGLPVGTLPIVNGAGGWANATGIELISLAPGVVRVHEDSIVRSAGGSDHGTGGQLTGRYPREVRADAAWKAGLTGRGVTVAVLDSGVSPDVDLVQPSNRVVASVNVAGRRDTPDPGGHGTHVAGVLAGNGGRSSGEFVGVAPEASLVDVRVLNAHGVGRVSSILRGLQWVVAHRAQYGIKVANLSLGASANKPYQLDLLAAASEVAWKSGVLVVVAAGNGGPTSGTVQSPGIDPYVVTVGATDDADSFGLSDDTLGFFSSWGTPPGSVAKPDLVAPGRRIVAVRDQGSYLDRLLPDRVVSARNGSTYFRLTGTSAATPMVAGAVALLLQRQSDLTPDQVKAILVGTTQPYGGLSRLPDPSADGAGLLDAYAVATSGPRGAANQNVQLVPTASGVLGLLGSSPANAADGVWDDGVWDDGVWDRAGWDDGVWDSGRVD